VVVEADKLISPVALKRALTFVCKRCVLTSTRNNIVLTCFFSKPFGHRLNGIGGHLNGSEGIFGC